MPGLADSVLDLGLNSRTVELLARELGDVGFAFRAYRRFIESYCNLIHAVDSSDFEEVAETERARAGWEATSLIRWSTGAR